jgi:hypothetical protein
MVDAAEPAAPAAPAAAVVRFALAPALAKTTMLDYEKEGDIKLFAKAIVSLEAPFDMRPKHLKLFLEEMSIRASAYGWNDVLDVPKDAANPLDDLDNLITSYGTITLERVRKHAETYLSTQTRAAQDSFMMYQCIMKTLTKEAKERIVLHK